MTARFEPGPRRAANIARVAATLMAFVLVGAACSSSTDSSRPPNGARIAPGGPSSPTGSVAAAASPGLAQGATGVTPPAASAAGTGRGSTSAPPGPAVAPGANFGPPSQGITAKTIKLGFWVIDSTAACGTFGVTDGPCAGDDRAEWRALWEYFNEHGGIAGRKIDPVLVVQEATRSQYSAIAQAACETFTQDEKVFAVLVPSQFSRGDLPNCLAQHNTPDVDAGTWAFDASDYAKLAGFLYQPIRPRPERWVRALIDGLHEKGFFAPGSRLGLVRYDAPPYTRVTERVLKPRLAAHGVKLVEEGKVRPQESLSGYGDMNAELNNIILRFKMSDIDRVIFFGTNQELAFFFLTSAQSQDFHPRYGFSTYDNPASEEAMAPVEQLRDAIGVGWTPRLDVGITQDRQETAQQKVCKKIFVDRGLDGRRGRSEKCDGMFFLKHALERAPALNPAGLRASVETLGSAYTPVATFSVRFGPGRYDGPAHFRHFAFFDGCTCFKYVSGLRAMP